VPNATVTATTTDFPTGSPNIPICTDGGSSGSPSTIGLVSTDAAGNSLTGVPLGHWSITATSGPLSNATPVNIWVTPTGVYDVTSSGAQTGPPLTSVSVVIN
jgi:hypothetical protein